MSWTRPAVAFGAALLVAALTAPMARALALRYGWVDHPGARKGHARPTPLLGGLALWGAVSAGWLAAGGLRAGGEVVAAALLVGLVGLWDDRRGLGPAAKLGVECLAALWVVAGGGTTVAAGDEGLAAALGVAWVLLVTNAVNLLDNADGSAAGTVAIGALSLLGVAATAAGASPVAGIVAALAGACVGFLPFNRHPASLFMGDAGSLFIGFLLAVSSLRLHAAAPVDSGAAWAPALVLTVPLTDTAFVVVSRLRRGLNPLTSPGRDHLAHRLTARGWTERGAVALLWAAGALAGLGGIVAALSTRFVAWCLLGVAAAIAAGICVRLAGAPR
ncbi:MAG: MraY family glycosyltransferase [Thermoanaerobaculia bacterium]